MSSDLINRAVSVCKKRDGSMAAISFYLVISKGRVRGCRRLDSAGADTAA